MPLWEMLVSHGQEMQRFPAGQRIDQSLRLVAGSQIAARATGASVLTTVAIAVCVRRVSYTT